MTPLRLLLVDDHPVVRTGLRGMFESDPGFIVVGEAADGGAGADLAAELLAGQRLYQGDSEGELFARVKRGEVRPVRPLNDAVSPELETLPRDPR